MRCMGALVHRSSGGDWFWRCDCGISRAGYDSEAGAESGWRIHLAVVKASLR